MKPFDMALSVDRFILFGIAAVMSLALWAFYRYSKFGLATTAVAENQRAAATVGLSPDRVATGTGRSGPRWPAWPRSSSRPSYSSRPRT